MKEKVKSALFSLLNVLLVAAVLLFILIGLAKIGLIDLPSFFAPFFGKDPNASTEPSDNGLSAILKPDTARDGFTVVKAEMTPESVRTMLSALTPKKTYAHDLEYTVYSGNVGSSRRVVLYWLNDAYLAYYVSPGAGAYKQVFEKDGTTSISVSRHNETHTAAYPTGDIDFAGEIGVILTHEDFLKTAGDDGYTYSLVSGDDGTLMLITFTSQSGTYTQTQTYKLNLDYGIVTEAWCYENDKLIYALSTGRLAERIEPDFAIPQEFSDLLPDELKTLLASGTDVPEVYPDPTEDPTA